MIRPIFKLTYESYHIIQENPRNRIIHNPIFKQSNANPTLKSRHEKKNTKRRKKNDSRKYAPRIFHILLNRSAISQSFEKTKREFTFSAIRIPKQMGMKQWRVCVCVCGAVLRNFPCYYEIIPQDPFFFSFFFFFRLSVVRTFLYVYTT